MTLGHILIITGLIICAVTLVNSSNDVIKKNKEYAKNCMKKFPVKKSSLQEMYSTFHVPEDKNLKCFLGCLLRKVGLIKRNYIDWNVSRRAHKKLNQDPIVYKRTEVMIKRCKKEIIPNFRDKCQLAADIISCKLKYSQKFGIPIMRMQ
uniref:Putative odorant-binding protein n=1 Tax=Triatoma brasiliensis TaxID=65344 RepID=A0A162RQC5_TRIBS|nr:putative odorant-binding protein [Triatoma brasiliensis]